MADQNENTQYTDIQQQFLDLLKKYPVKGPELIVDYVTSQGETVLEDPEKMAVAISECEITPVRRRQILKHWFAEKGVTVPDELLNRVGMPRDKAKEAEEKAKAADDDKKSKYSVDEDTGAIKVAGSGEKALTWTEAEKLSKTIKKEIAERDKGKGLKYVYDPGANAVRMAKQGEIGGTLEEAKDLKQMAEEGKGKDGGESPFITDSEGNWTLNPKARVTGLELMAMDAIRKAQERGEPVDPIEALSQASEKMKSLREAMGATGQQLPDWMTDPLKFIETINTLSGGGKVDEALKQQVASLEKTLAELKEERFKNQIEEQNKHIVALAGTISDLKEQVANVGKGASGKTEMDILHEVATEGIGVLKTELPGFRRDIKDALAGSRLPPPKTTEERSVRTRQLKEAVQTDKEIEETGRKLFFS